MKKLLFLWILLSLALPSGAMELQLYRCSKVLAIMGTGLSSMGPLASEDAAEELKAFLKVPFNVVGSPRWATDLVATPDSSASIRSKMATRIAMALNAKNDLLSSGKVFRGEDEIMSVLGKRGSKAKTDASNPPFIQTPKGRQTLVANPAWFTLFLGGGFLGGGATLDPVFLGAIFLILRPLPEKILRTLFLYNWSSTEERRIEDQLKKTGERGWFYQGFSVKVPKEFALRMFKTGRFQPSDLMDFWRLVVYPRLTYRLTTSIPDRYVQRIDEYTEPTVWVHLDELLTHGSDGTPVLTTFLRVADPQ